jgi:hypothetical protein
MPAQCNARRMSLWRSVSWNSVITPSCRSAGRLLGGLTVAQTTAPTSATV